MNEHLHQLYLLIKPIMQNEYENAVISQGTEQ